MIYSIQMSFSEKVKKESKVIIIKKVRIKIKQKKTQSKAKTRAKLSAKFVETIEVMNRK
jgi:hypothetical protein